jgi:hypothetical protein
MYECIRVIKRVFTYSYSMMQWRPAVVRSQPVYMSATEEGQCYKERVTAEDALCTSCFELMCQI